MTQDNAVLFINRSADTFSGKPYTNKKGLTVVDDNCKWNGQPYTFAPGEQQYFPAGIARHFAKHLAKREVLKIKGGENHISPRQDLDGNFDDPIFNELFLSYLEDEPKEETPVEIQVINKNKVSAKKEVPAQVAPEDSFAEK